MVNLGTRADPIEEVITILIEFQDTPHLGVHSVGYFDQLIFDSSGSRSMYDYFREASYNQMSISGDVAPSWYTSSKDVDEYGRDSASGVDDFYGPIYRLVVEAVQLADSDVNFADYDEDGDGTVDHVIIVHAGQGQESSFDTDMIWSHHWAVLDANPASPGMQELVADGVKVYGYTMLSEQSPLGVFAHEFGHELGLPDLYDIDDSSEGIGEWGVMGGGSWLGSPEGSRPSLPCAYSKAKLGWVDPFPVTTSLIDQPITSIRTNPVAFKLPIRDSNGEYFLVANRQKDGYDLNLPGSGLLIWHIDENVPDNSNDAHRMVDLEEADEKSGENPLDATDPWFDSADGFNPTSVPNSNAYGNVRTGWRVVNIGASGQTTTADISKQVLDDVAIAAIEVNNFVEEGDQVDIVVNVTNHGVRDQENVPVNLTIYYQEYEEENIIDWEEASILNLSAGAIVKLSFQFRPTLGGRHILEAFATLNNDEIPENNDRIAHFNSNELYFWDDVEAGNLSWTANTSSNRYRWDIIEDYPKGSYSPTHSWHFGRYAGTLSPVNRTEFTLTSANIYVPTYSNTYVVFHHKYVFGRLVELSGKRPDDQLSDKGYLEISIDGGSWIEIERWGDRSDEMVQFNWLMKSINITDRLLLAGTNLRLRFRVTSVAQPVGEGWWLDDIGVVRDEPQYGIVFKAYEHEKTVEPGAMATFLFKATNVGDFEDDFEITAEYLPRYWDYAISENATRVGYSTLDMQLRIDESALVYLKVQTPSSAERGTKGNATAVITSVTDDSVSQRVNVTVHIGTTLFDISLDEFVLIVILLFIIVLPIALVVDYLRKTRKAL